MENSTDWHYLISHMTPHLLHNLPSPNKFPPSLYTTHASHNVILLHNPLPQRRAALQHRLRHLQKRRRWHRALPLPGLRPVHEPIHHPLQLGHRRRGPVDEREHVCPIPRRSIPPANPRLPQVPQTHRHLPPGRRIHIRLPHAVGHAVHPPAPTAAAPVVVNRRVVAAQFVVLGVGAGQRKLVACVVELHRGEPDLAADGGGC